MARGIYIGGKIVWSTIPEINLLTGTAESIDLSAYLYNPRNREVTFSSVGSLPTGCSISGNYLNWNGNGTAAVTSVTIRAESNQYEADAAASIDVAAGGNFPPEWSQYIGPFNVPSNSTVGYVVATMSDYVTDPEDDALTITMNGSLPSGLTYNSTTKQVTVTGALTAGNTSNVTFTADDGYVEAAITTLTLSGGSAGKAWTFGHPFKQGDVPSGQYIAATGPTSFQADIRNRWSDGSVKFAVLSGVGGTSAELRSTTTAPSGSNVAEPSTTATVQFSSPATTVSLATARTNGSMSWTKATAHKVREILGPVMSEFHYYSPVSGDDHLAVWWYVRAYSSGAVEVETVVENGWLTVTSPTIKSYTATVTVAGTQTYSGAVSHYHHSRWSRVDWVGTDPAITPAHDIAYLKSTKLVPNYGNFGTATDFTYVTTSAPMATGNWRTTWGSTGDGYKDQIAPLPPWEALYLTTAHATTYSSTVANGRTIGSFSAHYRDEATGYPLRFSARSTLSFQQANLPAGTGGAAGSIDTAHAPSVGYFPYLLTGRRFFLEEAQFYATWHWLYLNAEDRNYADGLFMGGQVRQVAWGLRQLWQAACITPDAETTLRTEFITSLDANIADMYTNYGASYHPLGLSTPPRLGQSDSDEDWGNGKADVPAWQYDFLALVLGWMYDAEVTTYANLSAVRDNQYKFTIGRLGDTDGYNYRNVYQYMMPVATPEGALTNKYATFAEMYAAKISSPPGAGTDIIGAEAAAWGYSYIGHAMAACAYAVDHGYTGASASYARLTGSSSWSQTSIYADYPKWAVVPR